MQRLRRRLPSQFAHKQFGARRVALRNGFDFVQNRLILETELQQNGVQLIARQRVQQLLDCRFTDGCHVVTARTARCRAGRSIAAGASCRSRRTAVSVGHNLRLRKGEDMAKGRGEVS